MIIYFKDLKGWVRNFLSYLIKIGELEDKYLLKIH